MVDVFTLIFDNFEKAGFGIILFLMVYISNMGLGAWKSVKIEGMDFNWHAIADSVIKFIVLGISIGLLSLCISLIPVYATYVGVEVDTSVMETLNSVAIIGAFLTATIRYAVDGINKVREILGV